ncbi:hypothetical protein [Larkinella sp. C7]|uniref:hypothetical protein n=1 Tax=Larkinella sp. C7 TaxID=2576607 RepID=UPI0011110C21|nr:hypothetical protein [Larkinella sp. C7]
MIRNFLSRGNGETPDPEPTTPALIEETPVVSDLPTKKVIEHLGSAIEINVELNVATETYNILKDSQSDKKHRLRVQPAVPDREVYHYVPPRAGKVIKTETDYFHHWSVFVGSECIAKYKRVETSVMLADIRKAINLAKLYIEKERNYSGADVLKELGF